MKKLIILIVLLFICVACFEIGNKFGFQDGYRSGYSRGQVVLIKDLSDSLGYYVSNKNLNKNYYHFRELKDISVYLFDSNNVRTIALWKKVDGKDPDEPF